jgi:hypothetical protein
VYLRGGHGLGQAGRQAALLRHLLLHDLQSIFIIKQYTNLMLQYKIFALITILSRHMDKIKLTKKKWFNHLKAFALLSEPLRTSGMEMDTMCSLEWASLD